MKKKLWVNGFSFIFVRMKAISNILLLSLVFICSCSDAKYTSSSRIAEINLTGEYSECDLKLEDVAKVCYVSMAEDSAFLFSGPPQYMSENYVIFCNWSDGNVLFFDRAGKPLSQFNHRGSGPEEYNECSSILYDEKTDELFLRSDFRILVYNSSGTYLRTLPLDKNMRVLDWGNFRDDALLLYDDETNAFHVISKRDGSLISQLVRPKMEDVNLYLMNVQGENISVISGVKNFIVKGRDGFLLNDLKGDTLLSYNGEGELAPALVRTPSIRQMDKPAYVNAFVESSLYRFYRIVVLENKNNRLPSYYVMQNKLTGKIYNQHIILNDYIGKQVYIAPETIAKTNSSRCGYIELDLDELKDAYEKNLLRGELIDLVRKKMEVEDGNNVYVYMYFK